MLPILCGLIILAVAYSMLNEGLFCAAAMLVNVLLAGILTYSLWEPAADYLETQMKGSQLAGMEDHLAMMLLFALSLGALRFASNSLIKTQVQFNPNLDRFGGGLVGLLTGYLVAGFLLCAMETLPLSDDFLGFTPRSETEPPERKYFPPDRVWSATMRHAGAFPFSWRARSEADDPYDRYGTFDRKGTFELRYLRYRRYEEKDGKKLPPRPWQKEIDVE